MDFNNPDVNRSSGNDTSSKDTQIAFSPLQWLHIKSIEHGTTELSGVCESDGILARAERA